MKSPVVSSRGGVRPCSSHGTRSVTYAALSTSIRRTINPIRRMKVIVHQSSEPMTATGEKTRTLAWSRVVCGCSVGEVIMCAEQRGTGVAE